ncbi:DUF805 domain-containing protein [Hasllibacter sp. MH4015]|uniref:DUF805 domain-containing protein n=1 Tax=Hasllibacter sp. MH4015 TaxID=2854029 RepID=UPI001CD75FCA|nr:DUF805 domain-containing protein [Hasllibacter sp. MH4015]
MDFMTAVKHVFANYANFSGRARRSEYWWFYLFNIIVNVVASVVDGAIGMPIVSIVAFLALIVPGIAVAVRRMHDVGRSGWWLLILFVPLVGIILVIYWFVQRGTVGPNEYGADPYDAAPAV